MKIAGVIVLLLALLLLAGALLLPKRVRVEKSRTMAANTEAIHPLLANLRTGWPRWSPFGKAHDPKLQEIFSGPESGAGATESWTGGSVPPGHLTLTRADPSDVDFCIEMEGGVSVQGRISLLPQGPGTSVTWTDDVDLGGGMAAGLLGVVLRVMLGHSEETAPQQLERAAQAR